MKLALRTMNIGTATNSKVKRGKKYNSPIHCTKCKSCSEKALRFKIMKKVMNAKINDLLKIEKCANSILKYSFIATLLPINEINMNKYKSLLNLWSNMFSRLLKHRQIHRFECCCVYVNPFHKLTHFIFEALGC